jgi:hypothetical protein
MDVREKEIWGRSGREKRMGRGRKRVGGGDKEIGWRGARE